MQLVFAIHNHQPVGNLDDVVHEACDRAYVPFLRMLADHPEVRVNAHWSGPLFEWAEANRPELFELLEGTADQIEWLGGGFYEPLLPAIPENDRVDQLERMRTYLADRLDARPGGAWLAERVWEPILAGTLVRAGHTFTVLDDSRFDTPVRTYRSVDYFGRALAAFAISQPLRYAIPSRSPSDVLELLGDLRSYHDVVVFGDDGEKFGLWDRDTERLYGPDGWFAEFWELVAATDWLSLTTFERALTEHRPDARSYAAPGSYEEMEAWSGGAWQRFGVRYPSVDVMYRKMIALSRTLRRGAPTEARTGLLRGQSNCAYWRGAFGGTNLPHLRSAVHESLIAGRLAYERSEHRGRNWGELHVEDWDADLADEIHVELPDQSWVLDPADGGSLLYLDDKPSGWPVSDVMARQPEPHLPADGPVDRHPWRTFADLRMPRDAVVDDLAASGPAPPARYVVGAHDASRGSVTIRLTSADAPISKTITAEDRTLAVAYHLDGAERGRFGPLIPISVWEGAGQVRIDGGPWRDVDEAFMATGHRFRFKHEGRGTQLIVSLPIPGELFSLPIDTTMRDERGTVHVVRQGVVWWPHFTTDGSGVYEVTMLISHEE